MSASSAGSMTVTGAVSAMRATVMASRPRSSPRISTTLKFGPNSIGVWSIHRSTPIEFGERGFDDEFRIEVTGRRAE